MAVRLTRNCCPAKERPSIKENVIYHLGNDHCQVSLFGDDPLLSGREKKNNYFLLAALEFCRSGVRQRSKGQGRRGEQYRGMEGARLSISYSEERTIDLDGWASAIAAEREEMVGCQARTRVSVRLEGMTADTRRKQ